MYKILSNDKKVRPRFFINSPLLTSRDLQLLFQKFIFSLVYHHEYPHLIYGVNVKKYKVLLSIHPP